jgi:dipeptidyl aminopeptidase/acylaminoacyl peptidase
MTSERPLSVTIIAVLNFFNGAVVACSLLQQVRFYSPSQPLALALTLWSMCLFLIGFGLLEVKKWAYWAELGLAALLVVVEFVLFVRENQALSYAVAPSIAIIAYLLFGSVRHSFGNSPMQSLPTRFRARSLPIHAGAIVPIWLVWVLVIALLNERQTNDNGQYDMSPDWSPDGKQIAFASARDGDFDIWIMNSDGSGVRNLTNNTTGDYNPAWSPDGQSIVFSGAVGKPDEPTGLYIINIDGSHLRQVIDHECLHPDWSPDGQLLVCSLNDILHVVRIDGTNFHSLKVLGVSPKWSSDGKFIAYAALTGLNTVNIWIVNADGTNPRSISTVNTNGLDWSSDDRWLVFSSRIEHRSHLAIMDINGANMRRLTHLGNVGIDPDWSPDGKTIAFEALADIMVVNVDGSNVRNLINKNVLPPTLTPTLPKLSSTATPNYTN